MTRRNVLKGAKLNLCHAVLAVAVASCLAPIAAHAQSMETQATFNIPAGDLASAVDAFSRQSGLQILYRPELLGGKKAKTVSGSLINADALERLLKGSGIKWERVNGSTYVLKDSKKVTTEQPIAAPATSNPASSKRVEDVAELEKLVVVGSRLGSSPVESAMPIKVITREEIDRSGAGSIAQALSYMSEIPINNLGDGEIGDGTGLAEGNTNSTTVQMRGLARGTTLILINGRRAGDSASFSSSGQFDLSTIPLALVERIEILPAGASSVYGGDGLAGVINVVLRRDANGLELRVRKSSADSYGAEQVSAMWGAAWPKGNVTIAANWSRNGELYSKDRAITADQDYRRFGGTDNRSTFSNPGNIYSLAGCEDEPDFCSVPLSERGSLPGLNASFASVPISQGGVGLTPGDFLETQGTLNSTSVERHLKSAEDNHGVTMSGRYQIAPWIAAIAEFTYTKRDVPAYQNPLTIYLGEYGSYGAVVPANNPFNPFGVPVGIDYQFRDTGIFTTYMQKSYRGVFGLSGKVGHFEWDVSKTQTRDRSGTTGPASLNLDAVAAALNSTDPTTALNPFVGDGTAPATDDVMLSLYNNLDQRNESRTDVLTGYIRGPLMRVPAGDVLGLIGAEQQRQEITVDSDDTGLLVQYIEGVIKSRALFAELRLPILSPRAGGVNERLALSGAFRSESSDRTSERTRSETIGLEFRPTESLLLRATYSTAFRPLLAYNAVQTPYERRQFVRDPLHNPTQRVPVDTYLFGGVPEGLRPETSSTTTIGFLYRPSPGWSLSLTKWDIEFRDRIATISTQTIVNNEDRFPGRVRRNSTTGLLEFVDGRPVNVARNDTAGVDIGAEANWTTQVGDFYAGLTATYTSKFQQQLTDTSPTTENVSVYNPEGWAPRWKIVPRIEWLPNEWLSTFVVGRYVNKYLDSTPLSSGPNAGEYKALGEFWIVDLNANISLRRFVSERNMLADSKISLGATNLFNRLPEFCAGCSGNSYDASQYDILGRNVYAELRLSF